MRAKGWYWVFFRDPDGEAWAPAYFDPHASPYTVHLHGTVDGPTQDMPGGPTWYRDGSARQQPPSETASNHWTIGQQIEEPPKP